MLVAGSAGLAACDSFDAQSASPEAGTPNDEAGVVVPDGGTDGPCRSCEDGGIEGGGAVKATRLAGPLDNPKRMVVGAASIVYVTLRATPGKVVAIAPNGMIEPLVDDLANPNGIAAASGSLYVAVEGANPSATDGAVVHVELKTPPIITRQPHTSSCSDIAFLPGVGGTGGAEPFVAWSETAGAGAGVVFADPPLDAVRETDTNSRVEGPSRLALARGPFGQRALVATRGPKGVMMLVDRNETVAPIAVMPSLAEEVVSVLNGGTHFYVAAKTNVYRMPVMAAPPELTRIGNAKSSETFAAMAELGGATLLVATAEGRVYRLSKLGGGGLTEVASVPGCTLVDLVVDPPSAAYVLCGGAAGALWRYDITN